MMFAVHCCGFCGALPPIAAKDGPFHPFVGTNEDGTSAPVCANCAEDARRSDGNPVDDGLAPLFAALRDSSIDKWTLDEVATRLAQAQWASVERARLTDEAAALRSELVEARAMHDGARIRYRRAEAVAKAAVRWADAGGSPQDDHELLAVVDAYRRADDAFADS